MDDSHLNVTQSQREYLALVSLRLSSKQIARIVGRSEKAVDVACTRALKATGERSRFDLADRVVAQDPQLLQSLIQRFSLTAKTLADLRSPIPDDPATVEAEQLSPVARQDQPAWKTRLFAIAIAFGTLALAMVLIKLAQLFLMGAAAIH